MHDGLEPPAKLSDAFPSERANLDPPVLTMCAMREVVDEPFLVEAFQRFTQRRDTDGQRAEEDAARHHWLVVLAQETENLDLQRPELYGLTRIADRGGQSAKGPNLFNR
jgi:hypothetical protein